MPELVCAKSVYRCRKQPVSTPASSHYSIEENDIPEIIFSLPYAEKIVKQLLKHCLKKVKHCLNEMQNLECLMIQKKFCFISIFK